LEAMPDLLYSGALQYLDIVVLEYHSIRAKKERGKLVSDLEKAMETLRRLKPEINVISLEDETYGKFKPRYPKC